MTYPITDKEAERIGTKWLNSVRSKCKHVEFIEESDGNEDWAECKKCGLQLPLREFLALRKSLEK